MPRYDYECPSCGPFQGWRPMVEAAEPHPCPDCDKPAPRILTSPHIRGARARINYIAELRNEKSAHEPMMERRLKAGTWHAHHAHRHPQRSKRPWMIGH